MKVTATLLNILILLGSVQSVFSQVGGKSTYDFLDLTNSPRVTAMGGDFLAIKDDDITLALSNPSLLTKKMDNNLSLNFIDYFANINYGFVSYSKTYNQLGSFDATMQFVDYGNFTAADATGQITGNFSAGDYAANLGWGRELDPHFSIGANAKFIYSKMETYYSFGLGVDVAGTYYNKKRNFTASLIAKNIGREIKAYIPGNPEPLPFEIEAGISKKLEHVPFRLSIIFNHIEQWKLIYTDPSDPSSVINTQTGAINHQTWIQQNTENLARHLVIGGEFSVTKNFFLRLGYNYGKRQALEVYSSPGTSGFSWGVGIRVSKFNLSFARSMYQRGESPNYISITTNLSEFIKKTN